VTEPVYDEGTDAVYQRLPDVFQNEDASQNWMLKKWLAGLGFQVGQADTIIDRLSYVSPEDGPGYRTSDLTDPMTADPAWLPWLAQLVGIKLAWTGQSTAEQRDVIRRSILGIKAGTKAAMAEAAGRALTGTKAVTIYDHTAAAGAIGAGTQWQMRVVTKDTETLTNSLPVDQATFTSTNGWDVAGWHLNLIGNTAWTTTGMTAGTGSTDPLLTNYSTFSGAGDTYTPGTAYPGVPYHGSVMLRCTDGLATTADLALVWINGANAVIDTTTVSVTGIGNNWKKYTVSGTAPAGTATVRLRLTRAAAGVLHASNKLVTPGIEAPVYFDSTFTGAGTDDIYVTYPIKNEWRNPSFDATGGYTLANCTFSASTERFLSGTTGGLVTLTASSASISPTLTLPVFESEVVNGSVQILGFQPGGSAQIEFRFTLANGTTSSVFGDWTTVSAEDWTSVAATATAPVNAKNWQIFVHFANNTGHMYWLDNGFTTRLASNLGYFDGHRPGFSWTNVDHTQAIVTRDAALPVNVTTETFVARSNTIQAQAYATGMAVRAQMAAARSSVAVVAGDPWTFLLGAYATQSGSYTALFQVVFLTAGNAEVSRFSAAYPMTAADTVVSMMLQGVVPATATQARLRVSYFGTKVGDRLGVTRAAARQGSNTEWIGVTANPIAEIIKAGAKPAGVILYNQTFSASWSAIEAALPTWADWETKTWTQIEETGL
jgi:hypothetical protein